MAVVIFVFLKWDFGGGGEVVHMNTKQTPCAAKPLKRNKINNVAVAWVTLNGHLCRQRSLVATSVSSLPIVIHER